MPGGGGGGGGGARVAPASSGNNTSNASSARGGAAIIDDDLSYQRPKSTIDAVDEIQRFYVFESRADKDLPYDFFTFKQVVEFLVIGFRAALMESLFFFFAFPVAVTIYPAAKAYFFGVVPTIEDYILPLVVSYAPVLIMTIYVVSAARFYKAGRVTRKAIHSLFVGRSGGFFLKAFLGWWLLALLYIHSYNSPQFIWHMLDLFRFIANLLLPPEAMINTNILYEFWYQAVVPALMETADDLLVSMIVIALLPFCTLFAYGGFRRWRGRKNLYSFAQYNDSGKAKFKKDALHLGIGFSITDYRKDKLLNIYQENVNRKGHTLVIGTTRVGKTRLLQNMIVQDIYAGNSVAVVDPKGDEELFSAIVQAAYNTGRQDEIIFVSPFYPEYSAELNPLFKHMIEEEIINCVVAGVPQKEEFCLNVAIEYTTVIVKTLLLQKRHEDIPSGTLTIKDIDDHVSYEGIKKCKEIVAALVDQDEDAPKVLSKIEDILNSERDYFSKVSTTLRTTLT
jgi:hypothetical protein